MKARLRFYARGQSDAARGVAYIPARIHMQSWPLWARQAYCAGRLSVQGKARAQGIGDFIGWSQSRFGAAADAQIERENSRNQSLD